MSLKNPRLTQNITLAKTCELELKNIADITKNAARNFSGSLQCDIPTNCNWILTFTSYASATRYAYSLQNDFLLLQKSAQVRPQHDGGYCP